MEALSDVPDDPDDPEDEVNSTDDGEAVESDEVDVTRAAPKDALLCGTDGAGRAVEDDPGSFESCIRGDDDLYFDGRIEESIITTYNNQAISNMKSTSRKTHLCGNSEEVLNLTTGAGTGGTANGD